MSEFDEFEEKLAREMARVPAPEGFADRVMASVAQRRKTRLVVMPRRSAWMAIAAMLMVGVILGGWQWQQRRQAEQARQQFDLAMQVTQRTLAGVQERIGRAGEIHNEATKREVEQ